MTGVSDTSCNGGEGGREGADRTNAGSEKALHPRFFARLSSSGAERAEHLSPVCPARWKMESGRKEKKEKQNKPAAMERKVLINAVKIP